MILVAPCDEPRSCPGVNRSIPSTRRPRWESSLSAALPVAPRPQTTTSKRDISVLQTAYGRQKQAHHASLVWLRPAHLADGLLQYRPLGRCAMRSIWALNIVTCARSFLAAQSTTCQPSSIDADVKILLPLILVFAAVGGAAAQVVPLPRP